MTHPDKAQAAAAPEDAVRTRRVTISERKAANVGAAYLDTFVGLDVAVRTFDGDVLLGRVESFYGIAGALVRLDNGRTFRAGRDLDVVTNAADL